MTSINNRIRIAVQKSGRLSEESLALLARCGIKVKPRKEQLFCHSDNFPLDLLFVRDDDIPSLICDGVCDFGIVGTNLLQERSTPSMDLNYKIIQHLGFAACRLAIAIPKSIAYQGLGSLNNCRIATSYPNLLSDFIKKTNLNIEIVVLSGSVEIAPRLGIADGICDLVSTGATLEANNLQEVITVFKSEAILVQSGNYFNEEKLTIAKLFKNRIEGAVLANGSKYIMLHAPKSEVARIVTLLPGSERPTILNLQGDNNKVAIHALCRESIFWETMELLKLAGASSILVLPVEKMMN